MKKLLILILCAIFLSCTAGPPVSFTIHEGEIAIWSRTSFFYEGEAVTFALGPKPMTIESRTGQKVWTYETDRGETEIYIGKGSTTFL